MRYLHSLHSSSSVLFSYCTHLLLHTWIILNNNHNNLQQQQQPQLFSVPCIYSFCAPCACSVRNASACWLRAVILHLSSALSDHHRDSSASLVVHPVCPASLYVILRFLSLSGSLRLFVFSKTVELLIFIDPDRRFMILMNQQSWSHRDLASRCSFIGDFRHSKSR